MVKRRLACDNCTQLCDTFHRKPRGPSPIAARFFSVIFGKNDSKFLLLPPKFVRKVNLASQETEIEDSSGSRWSVKLSYANGLLAFKDGWCKFFRYHGLEDGNLLVFNYIKESHFVVQIYRRSGCEVLNFNNVRIWSNKRRRIDSESVSQDEPFQTPGVNSRNKRCSSAPFAPRSEHQNRRTHLRVRNADLAGKKSAPISASMDDPSWMINRDDSYYQEDRNILYDLSSFEMEKQTPDANKTGTAFTTVIAPSHTESMEHANEFEITLDTNTAPYHTGLPEQTKTSEDDTQMAVVDTDLIDGHSGDVPACKFEKALDPEVAPSHANITKRSKTNKGNAKMAVIQTHQTYGNSGDIVTDKFDKALTKLASSSHIESMEWTEIIEDDTQMPVTLLNKITSHLDDIFTDKFHTRPSNNSILSKGKSVDVSNLQNSKKTFTGKDHVMASDSQTPFAGSSKIAESAVPEDPYGYRATKKERGELGEKAYAFPEVYSGENPTVVGNYDQMFPPVVKVEPDLSDEVISLVEVSSFSAEVKSQSYLELRIPSMPERRGRGKIVHLKDPNGRMWPLLYLNTYTVKALTATWPIFCQHNNIKPGDKCRFQVENEERNEKDHRYIYKVDVAHRSDRLLGN